MTDGRQQRAPTREPWCRAARPAPRPTLTAPRPGEPRSRRWRACRERRALYVAAPRRSATAATATMSTSGANNPPAAPEAAPSPGPPAQAPPSPSSHSADEDVTPPPGAVTELRLVGGGRVVTRLAPHSPACPLLPRDDGYHSSDSTPKTSGETRCLVCTLSCHPLTLSQRLSLHPSTPLLLSHVLTVTLAIRPTSFPRPRRSMSPWLSHTRLFFTTWFILIHKLYSISYPKE
ncbi:hypothetical protein E2C01_004468 [Portunus trituberculatus]|uniref:Uncharacterized protein n=1 Tax=Portunus trituberculatus TaxID=210409 RepID=A0A5B7CWG3_PORTR|nr:hypothetical protein [Portunus trituberculatus]